MSLRVMKFGGAALRDAEALQRVARIITRAEGPRVVVVSAMQGVTDALQGEMDLVRQDEAAVFPLLDAIGRRHRDALAKIAPDGDEQASYALEATLERLERLLYGIAYTQEITPRLRDQMQSFGERLSAPLVAAACRGAGIDAIHLDAEHAGIHTQGPFGNARPDAQRLRGAVRDALLPHVDKGTIPVVTGYYGVDAEGNPTLFGRGGSDYVASLLAAALDAEVVELWKEVPGFMTTDPKAVPAARLIDSMSYDEAAELAHFGAHILHPRSVEPVEQSGIPIQIRWVDNPDDPGTIIRQETNKGATMVRSAASRSGLSILRLNGPGMGYTAGVAKQVFDALAKEGINVLNMATSQASFALLLDEEDGEGAKQALSFLQGGVVQSIELLPHRSLVCVVGRGLGETPGSAASILQAVARANVNIEMISLGASDIAIDFIIESKQAAAALAAVHKEFLEETVTA